MHTFIKRFLALGLLACIPLVLTACGGGGGSNSVEMTTISGIAIKGPIKRALVQVFKLGGDGSTGELLGVGTTRSDAGHEGKYEIQIPKAKATPPLLVTVSGQAGATYTSESTGSDVLFTNTKESFSAVLDTFDTGKKYTVSPLTDAAYQQLQKFITDNPASPVDARIVSAANARVATLFNVSDILADPATDLSYSAALKIIDQMIKTSGSGNTLQTMSLINQAFADVTAQPYQKFRAELTAAAIEVGKDPTITNIVNAIVATTTTPPDAPNLTDTTAPDAVTSLQAVPGAETATTGFVTLTWSAATTTGSNPVAGYDIYRNGTKIASVSSTSYSDKTPALSTTYTYYVIAFDAAGNRSLPSSEVSATTPSVPNLNVTVDGQLSSGILLLPQQDILAPTAATNLRASTSAISATNSSVQLEWAAPADNVAVAGYDVYRNGSKIVTVTLAAYEDASVTSGTTYTYYVISFDAAGNRSPASSELLVTPNQASLGVTVSGQVSPPL